MADKKNFGAGAFFAAAGAVIAGFGVLFWIFGLQPLDYLKFLGGLAAGAAVPGVSLFMMLRLQGTRMERTFISLVLGMTSSVLFYRLAALAGARSLFLLWLAGHLAHVFFRLIKNPPRGRDFRFSINRSGVVFVLLAAMVLAVMVSDNFRNGISLPDGSLQYHMHYLDGFVRNAVVRELSHSVPPQMSFAAGRALSYHHAMDLFAAVFYRHLGLEVPDLLHRLTMAFFFFLLMGNVYVFMKRWTGRDSAGNIGIFLIVFCSGGLGFLFGLLAHYPAYWGKLFYSFYFLDMVSLNSFLPSIPILCAGFFCLMMHLKSGEWKWLLPAAFLLAVIADYKMTFAAPVLGGLGLAGMFSLIRHRDIRLLKAGVLTGLMLIPLVVLAYVHNQNGPQYQPTLAFNNWIIFPLKDLKFSGLERVWVEMFLYGKMTLANILLGGFSALGFLAASFGLNTAALPQVIRSPFRFKKDEGTAAFMSCFFVTGVLFFFFFRSLLAKEVRTWTNIYVFFLAVIVLAMFWARILDRFLSNRKTAARILIIALIAAVGLPNTVQFMWAKIHHPQTAVYDRSFMDLCRWLNKNTDPDAVIIHSRALMHLCYFSDRRVVLDQSPHSYLEFHLTAKQIRERTQDVEESLRFPDAGGHVYHRYGVTYLVSVAGRDQTDLPHGRKDIPCFSYLGGEKLRKYRRTHVLNRVQMIGPYQVYRIRPVEERDEKTYILDTENEERRMLEFSGREKDRS